jgi:DNA repair photolyase
MSAKEAKISGTKEWAKYNANCIKGCRHDCRYALSRFLEDFLL